MSDFAQTLKTWRKRRRFSQLDLALEANVSARHLSFLETGRARPSVEMIARLGDALHLPLAARNQMLTHAGFATRYVSRDWNGDDMAPIRAAVSHMLQGHAPYPAIALDRLWTVVQMNAPALVLFGALGLVEGGSLLDVLISDVLPENIENWPEVAHHSAQRLRTESAAEGGIAELDRVADHLAQGTGHPGPSASPVVPTIYRHGDVRLALFATIAQFGTPEDLTLNSLKIEMFFPADPETEQILRAMAC